MDVTVSISIKTSPIPRSIIEFFFLHFVLLTEANQHIVTTINPLLR